MRVCFQTSGRPLVVTILVIPTDSMRTESLVRHPHRFHTVPVLFVQLCSHLVPELVFGTQPPLKIVLISSCDFIDWYLMFHSWSAASLRLGGSGLTDPARSRSPPRHGVGGEPPAMPALARTPEHPWSTGNPNADQWVEEQGCDPQVLSRFASLPKHKRRSIIVRCMSKAPDNLSAWLGACARNWEEQDLEARVTGIASVHRAAGPAGSAHPYGASSAAAAPQAVTPASVQSSSQVPSSSMDPSAFLQEVNGTLPTVSTKLYAAWPMQKSALIRVASENLSGGALAVFFTLPVPDQTALAFTIMVAAPENPTLRAALIDAWLNRLATLRGSTPLPTSPTLSAASAESVSYKVQFILAGLPTCMCAVVVASVQLILPKLHPQVSWDFCPVLFLTEEAADGVPMKETFEKVGLPIREDITSLQSLVAKMSCLLNSWSADRVKFVLVSCLTHDAGLCGSNTLQPHHLHAKGNRWLWGMVSASEALRNQVGNSSVADVLITSQNTSAEFVQEVSTLWGQQATGMERFDDERLAGSPRPAFFCTPSGLSIVPVCECESNSSQLIDEWTGPTMQKLSSVQNTCPGFVPSHVSKLATESLFREREFNQEEINILKWMRMRHSSGEERLCSRQFWCRWYGYNHTPVQNVLLDHEACAGMIIPTTGTVAPPGLPASSTSACGKDRYCLGCETHLDVLSRGFQTYVVTDLLLALLTKASQAWTKQDAGSIECWTRLHSVAREHVCGDDCPLVRR